MFCADGGKHSWHFFKRGFRFRQCRKCPRVETLAVGSRGKVWQKATSTTPF